MNPFNINDTLLGKQAATPGHYDASLLFRIPRSENRIKYGIDDNSLPFLGYDTWNCYELSFLTKNGLPVSRVLKMVYPADSRYIVESKSLKLYLNSFNMERLEKSVADSESRISAIISNDLSSLLETKVQISLFDRNSEEMTAFETFQDITTYLTQKALESISFTHYQESPDILKGIQTNSLYEYIFRTDLLRSNCRVTSQPDWGDLFVRMETKYDIDLSSVIAYIVSFRKENHFHEEVVEMIYKRFYDSFKPEKLLVAAMYTRRGGIDINPIRTNQREWLDEAFLTPDKRLAKTIRQ